MEQVIIMCPPEATDPRLKLQGSRDEGRVIVPLAQPPDFAQEVLATLHDMRMHGSGVALANSSGTSVGAIRAFEQTEDGQAFRVSFGDLTELSA